MVLDHLGLEISTENVEIFELYNLEICFILSPEFKIDYKKNLEFFLNIEVYRIKPSLYLRLVISLKCDRLG